MAQNQLPLLGLLDDDEALQTQLLAQQGALAPAPAEAPARAPASAPAPVPPKTLVNPEFSDENLKQVLSNARETQNNIQIQKGASKLGAGLMGLSGRVDVKPDVSGLTEQQHMAMQPVNDLQARIGNQSNVNTLKKQQVSMDRANEVTDPNSEISKLYRGLASQMGLDESKLGNASAADIENVMGPMQRYFSAQEMAKMRQQMQNASSADRAEARANREQLAADRLQHREDEDMNKNITKYSERLAKAGVPSATETLQQIDSFLQGGLDKATEAPGYGRIAGAAPDWMTGDKGNELRKLVQKLANVQLKDRSGAAVSDQEYVRFQREFGTGTFKNEAQLIEGLRNYRNVLKLVTQELESAAPRDALSEYKSRPGSISSEDIPDGRNEEQKKPKKPGKTEAPPAPTDDMVLMETKDGKRIKIPVVNVDKAIERGAKVVN